MVKKVGKYEIGRTLGEGTFGKVKHAVNLESGEAVAIKILDKEKIQKQNMSEQIRKEISVMKMIKHKHIVELREVLHSKTKIFIVLELVVGGELFDKIVAEGRLVEKIARTYFQQLIDGLEYCHAQGVCHRDIKPENLLLDAQGMLKISDFGLSYLYGSDDKPQGTSQITQEVLHTTCGTPNYVAPEVLQDKGYDGRYADIWSCGVVLYVLLAGFLPFDEPTMAGLFRKILKGEYSFPSWFSAEAKSLISKILITDPKKRYTIAQIKQHPWFKPGYQQAQRIESIAEQTPSAQSIIHEVSEPVKLPGKEPTGDAPPNLDGTSGPQSVNAFEVLSMLGSLDISSLFSRNPNAVARKTRFASKLEAKKILGRISQALSEMGAGHKVLDNLYKVKVATSTSKGLLTFSAQVYSMAPGIYMVEVQRGKGDTLEYHKFYKRLHDMLQDIILQ